jgi:transcriptional regulator with XRE-family HTH domain
VSGFSARLKERREQLGLTLRDVEAITDGRISNAYLSQLENGKIRNPSAMIALTLAAAYHVSVEETLSWMQDAPIFKPPELCPTCGRAIP